MRRILLLIGLVILIPLTLLALGAKTDSYDNVKSELKSLRSQVKSLENRVKIMEVQLLAERAPKDLPLTIPRQIPQTPKGWQKREFNGIPYFVMPLQQNSNK